MKDFVYNGTTDVINFMLGGGNLGDVKSFLTQATSGLSSGNAMSYIYNIFKSVAIAMLVLYFLIDVYDEIAKQRFTLDLFMKSFIRLLLSYLIVANGLEILSAVVSIGDSLITNFYPSELSGKTYSAGLSQIQAYLNDLDNVQTIGVLIQMIIPYIVVFVTKVIVYFIGITRGIELCARICIAPIAISNSYEESSRNASIRYIKKLAAVSLQGLCVLVIIWSGSFAMLSIEKIRSDDINTYPITIADTTNALTLSFDFVSYVPSRDGSYDLIGKLNNLPTATTIALMQDPSILKEIVTKSADTKMPIGDLFTDIQNFWNGTSGDEKSRWIEKTVGCSLFESLFDWKNVALLCVVQFAVVGAAIKSQSVANDLVGV